MQMEEFIGSLSNGGLQRILKKMGRPYSYSKPELEKLVTDIAKEKGTKAALECLTKGDLKKICQKYKIASSDAHRDLVRSIERHSIKVVDFDSLVKDVEKWKPECRYKSEEGYQKDLKKFLKSKGYDISPVVGAERPDLLINNRFPIEAKYDFSSRDERDRATGQLARYLICFRCCIFVVCGYYGSKQQFYEDMGRRIELFSPEVREKCVTVLKNCK